MKSTSFIFATCIISIFLVSIYGCHNNKCTYFGSKSCNSHIEKIADKLTKELDLTADQRNHLNIIKDEISAKLFENNKHGSEMLNIFKEEIKKDSIDQQRLERQFNDRKQFREDMHRFLIKKAVEFHSTLTKEQRMKLVLLIDKMGNKFDKE